ncbi:TonB-dependent receptor plug domain-containing protein [Marinobacter psychrophilus]|uniref:TonB-dependent receptor plug domain-containing protein n=1 Tax=Marinobacter psychrophilus TaxID=330734 RepID=UPI000A034AB1
MAPRTTVVCRATQAFSSFRLYFSAILLGVTIAVAPALAVGNDIPGKVEPLPGFYGFSDDIPEVLTTTRLRQPKTRVPGTTTVIEGDLIRQLGINSLVEIFRLVPGMVVGEVGSGTPVTTYHGTVHYEQRRMQVLINGRTAHRATLSDMDWQSMPIALELIERIEVSRGPNSAAYGINAFLGTINFIARDPGDTAGTELRIMSGSRDYQRTFASIGDATKDIDWRLAFEKREFGGFDYQQEQGEFIPFHDGQNLNFLTFDSRLKLKPDFNIELRAGVTDGVNEEDQVKSGSLGAQANPDIDVQDFYLDSRFNIIPSADHFFHVQISFENFKRRQRWPVSVPKEAVLPFVNGICSNPAGSSVNCSNLTTAPESLSANLNADSEDSRLELELQDTLVLSDTTKLVSGLGYRHDTYRSETFFNGRGTSEQYRVFGNLEYSPTNWLTFNGGANWEHTDTTGQGYFSPRLAANLIFNNQHALRFVYSEAVRTPDSFEQNPNYGFVLRNVNAAYASELEGYRLTTGDIAREKFSDTLGVELHEEKIRSHEISYFGQFPLSPALLTLEVRGFKDEMRDMISGVIQFEEWNIDNSVDIDQKGFEVESTLVFPLTTLRASYGYLDQDTRYSGPLSYNGQSLREEEASIKLKLLERLSVRHSGSIAAIQTLPWNVTAASVFYWADEFRNSQFERFDIRLAKQIIQPRYTAELAFVMQHYLNREFELSSDNNIANQNQFFVEAGLRF